MLEHRGGGGGVRWERLASHWHSPRGVDPVWRGITSRNAKEDNLGRTRSVNSAVLKYILKRWQPLLADNTLPLEVPELVRDWSSVVWPARPRLQNHLRKFPDREFCHYWEQHGNMYKVGDKVCAELPTILPSIPDFRRRGCWSCMYGNFEFYRFNILYMYHCNRRSGLK